MPLITGTRLGPYEILSALGAGGMGEVYRARDTKLGREVAVKVLPEAFAFDPDRVARFEREAKVLASLNHPHIAALYGMEESGGRHFLVMELVDGVTIAERIGTAVDAAAPNAGEARQAVGVGPHGQLRKAGPLPVEEALSIAHQICEALEAAHEKGVVHRDLKPANVKITPEENVKVLDFGLAKMMDPVAQGFSPAAATNSPTLSMMATQAGVILGTAAYMSPEQAKGFQADTRSDVFSFGSVLYEMLTGRQPFQGDTAPEILASVLVREPDFGALPPNLNPRLPELLRRCLEKNPKRRWQAVGDLRAEIEAIVAAPRAVPAPTALVAPPQPLWRYAIAVLVTAILTSALTGIAMWNFRSSATPPTVSRFSFTLADGQQITTTGLETVAISPDGMQMVYVANNRLYLRLMSELESRPISGTEIAQFSGPVFSPDGRSIAFYSYADRALKRIAVSGGAAVTICPADPPFGMSWGSDGIVFGQTNKGIVRVSANGGKPELLVSVKSDERAHGPQMLPDGQTVLFTLSRASVTGADRWDKAYIVVHSLRSGERKTLIEGGSDTRYLPTGHIVYAVGGVLFAVPFDLRRLEVTGGPVPIVEGVRRSLFVNSGSAHFSFSDTGSLIYVPGPVGTSTSSRAFVLVDRRGGTERLKLPPGAYVHPRVSPDGKHIVFGTDDGKEAIVWNYDLAGTSAMRRLTFGAANRFPIWSADGQRVAFQSDRGGDLGIFWQRADGTGTAERLTKAEQGTSHAPESWSPDGKRFLFAVTKGSTVSLWTFSIEDKKVAPFGDVHSTRPISSVFSPDGRWVAYSIHDPGTDAVYIQPFPATGARHQTPRVNVDYHPVWAPDGKELFYIPSASRFVAVSVNTQPSLTFGNPVDMTRALLTDTSFSAGVRNYDITSDGKFIGLVDPSEQIQSGTAAAPEIRVVLNWFEELKQRVPTTR